MKFLEVKQKFENVLDKMYESIDLTIEILEAIDTTLNEINKIMPPNHFYREIKIFVDKAKKTDNLIKRNNLRSLILENLEEEYRKVKEIEIEKNFVENKIINN